MKKVLSIMLMGGFLFFSANLFGQETIVLSENFDGFTAGTTGSGASSSDISGGLDTLTQTPGWSGSKVYQAGGTAKMGTGSALGFLQTPIIDLSGDGGIFVIRFKAMAWSGDSTAMKVTVNGTTHILRGLSNSGYTLREFELYLTGGNANSVIKFEGLQAAKGRFFMEDLVIATVSGPIIAYTPTSLNFGDVQENGTSVKSVNVTAYNLSGSNYTVAVAGTGFSSTITSVTGNELTTGISIPVTFSPTTAGSYTGTLTISGGDLTTPKVCNLSGNCVSVISVATIAELKTKLDFSNTGINFRDTITYRLTGEVIVTSVDNNYYHYSTIQDSTAAIIIYSTTSALVSGIEKGQKIKDIYGKLTNYYGLLEFTPVIQEPVLVAPFTADDAITPLDVTFEDMLNSTYMKEHQAKVIRINEASFATAGTFAANTKYNITNGTSTDSLVYTFFRDAECVGTSIPQGVRDITGICYLSYNKYYLIPRTRGDVVSINDINLANQIGVYPNPVTNQLFIEGITPQSVEFYNILGNHIFTINNPGNVISTENLSNGIYLVRFITEEGIAVKKIIKQ